MYCYVHKLPKMVNLTCLTCKEPSCTKVATYTISPTEKSTYCSAHKKTGMIPKKTRKKCTIRGCILQPNYNYIDSIIGIYCSVHKKIDMVLIYA